MSALTTPPDLANSPLKEAGDAPTLDEVLAHIEERRGAANDDELRAVVAHLREERTRWLDKQDSKGKRE